MLLRTTPSGHTVTLLGEQNAGHSVVAQRQDLFNGWIMNSNPEGWPSMHVRVYECVGICSDITVTRQQGTI